MKTVRLRISDVKIKEYLKSDTVTRLRDERYALELRFHKSRESATWWLIDKRKNNGKLGKPKWERLGLWPRLSAKALFELLPQKIARMATETDQIVTDWTSFGDCLRWYVEHIDSNKDISAERKSAVRSVVFNHLIPALNDCPLTHVRKHHIKDALIWPLRERYELRTVKGYFAILKAAFNQAYREEHIAANPMAGMVFSDFIKKKITPNEGKIQSDDVQELLERLKDDMQQKQVFILMQLAHGTRIRETRLARWSHIDWDEGIWRIPACNAKNGEALMLPLTWQVRNLLMRYRATQSEKQKFIFPNSKGDAPICKDTANDIYAEFSAGAFTSHHCRKLVGTRLTDLGVDKFVRERILNHKMSDLDQAYIHTTTEALKLKALQTYHNWLDLQGFVFFHGKTEGRSENMII
ncbi:tyrosine-type recombinase/integrase [Vibrio vulnificus]|uniref:tyrosine-type recombinase/integrase n=1 Tax=Vibrio vulnificus TaxID=672 RepID=UPI0013EE4028|nr:tyrosine-type recombinase/integrase [Vibrio vulnificus]EHU9453528.1 tyrosine-type recombinase/integrase [Vibrio vulnificus]EJO2017423.1 tyrosine-type recombinase/integrase [Vibrio vulnificus]ELH9599795.1 tyrosine-type recombinase/integrase [Vibrio vulnificus]ELH9614151.1 tyrosine-type recombinase/integrase [Vibrio vulnificus]MCU8384612.1 tyrosine-type recombinase/integrase [Vibrio vulnificus]